MDANEESGNSIGTDAGGGADSVETNVDNLQGAAQQLTTAVSRFAQGAENGQDNLDAVLERVSGQSTGANADIQEIRAEIRKLENWIRYNRG
ncbi:MAG TPA: hypothetical protein VHY22_06685 [Chthoniobacteraceae bacterium]|jgi:hypothetical protein|nr:hypothetical protein [Chthoniobacteraceae bacterium]